jgi:YebC/PmpR family DNA-binding regulatory protein
MAGHSHSANIKHRKSTQDLKKCLQVTKLLNTVRTFAKNGSDPSTNVALRSAVEKALEASVPKEKIENAINRASGLVDGVQVESVRYNATIGVISVIIECSTTNKNRTANDVRYILSNYGATVVPSGSVEFSFDQLGVITYQKDVAREDDFIDTAIEVECSDVFSKDETYVIYTERAMLHKVLEKISQSFASPSDATIAWIPQNYVDVDTKTKEKVTNLKAELEENMDVQGVFVNVDI